MFYPEYLKYTSNVMTYIKTFEASQIFCRNSNVSCPCKIKIQNYFWHKTFIGLPISKRFAAHFTTNVWLNIGKYIFYLVMCKLKIIKDYQRSVSAY